MKRLFLHAAMLLALALAGCDIGKAKEDMVPTSLTGIDHLADHLSVQDFRVNRTSGFQAGTGGSVVCCVNLPRKWRPDLTVVVGWEKVNWRDCGWESYERRVPVERYDKVGRLYVHFLSDGAVRAISSGIGPGIYGPNPGYPGPQDAIPDKRPWHVYGSQIGRCPHQDDPTVMERAQ
jgi:hypothetical protein